MEIIMWSALINLSPCERSYLTSFPQAGKHNSPLSLLLCSTKNRSASWISAPLLFLCTVVAFLLEAKKGHQSAPATVGRFSTPGSEVLRGRLKGTVGGERVGPVSTAWFLSWFPLVCNYRWGCFWRSR
ncbi:hypothetical protein DM860_001391 [Cuscuta australis]|uniref:Uncharacterized protein n=1 Tax=Cuscuta australis TaxID=267555 RepID=A0A328ECF5_9ASTE|nr:hypothetical protein DM860_001391 [Cuscuta australis]